MISCSDHVLHRTGNRSVRRVNQLSVLTASVTTFDRRYGELRVLCSLNSCSEPEVSCHGCHGAGRGSQASNRVPCTTKQANNVVGIFVGIQDDAVHLKLVFMRLTRRDRNDTLPRCLLHRGFCFAHPILILDRMRAGHCPRRLWPEYTEDYSSLSSTLTRCTC